MFSLFPTKDQINGFLKAIFKINDEMLKKVWIPKWTRSLVNSQNAMC